MIKDDIEKILSSGGIGNFRQEARWIIEECTSDTAALQAAQRRASGEPLQYVLGNAPFRYLTLDVDPRVLIPRPETESLVEWVLKNAPHGGKVLDLGCGSGAIALSVAHERPDLLVTAVDLSADALTLARHNAEKNALTARVEFVQSNLFSALSGQRFDVVAANLPYVTRDEYPLLDAEVRDFEPEMALVADDDGLALILQSIAVLPEHLNSPGMVIYELSPPQASRCAAALKAQGVHPEILLDLCGRERFVTGKR